MIARTITAIAVAAALVPGSGATVEPIQSCALRPPMVAAGLDASSATPVACEGAYVCASETPCEISFTGRLYGIGVISFEHTAIPGSSCTERGSQAHCTAGTVRIIQPGEQITWTCAAGTTTVAARVELDCTAARVDV